MTPTEQTQIQSGDQSEWIFPTQSLKPCRVEYIIPRLINSQFPNMYFPGSSAGQSLESIQKKKKEEKKKKNFWTCDQRIDLSKETLGMKF
ncbi:predicted protein [Sclerotinia sclerotiorum 1980 UF-70]|uniref:Uncharacterized protein n=1 Tax=Sclerotinia sclerotiorum (strain ATCC 18683 / 1980 / Ss-1) TaxID=665079 RepID=A7EA72_SCLS1|nr:predicted protein [Sclerotinia sclerotiorum 1980 UF-70]EDN99350.1 predicted protein [Sclerotinia sclerotiorum 1980 UF-70]